MVRVRPKSSIPDFPPIRSEFDAVSSVLGLGSGGARVFMLPGLAGDLRVYAATSDAITGAEGNTDSEAIGNDISEAADLDAIILGGAVPTPTKGYMGLLCSDPGGSFLTEFSGSGELVFRPCRADLVYAASGFGSTEPKSPIQSADADTDCFAGGLVRFVDNAIPEVAVPNVADALALLFMGFAPLFSVPSRSMFGGHFLHGFFVLDPSVYNKVWIRTFTQLFHPEQGSIGGGISPVLGSLLQDFKSLTLFLRFKGSFPRRRRWYRIKQLRPWVVDLGSSVLFGYVQRLALGCYTISNKTLSTMTLTISVIKF